MAAAANNAGAQRAQQTQQQQELQRQTGDLMKGLNQLAPEAARAPQAQQALQQAAASSQQAQNSMQQAQQSMAQQGNTGQAQQSGQQAAQSLDQAARQADQAAQQLAQGIPGAVLSPETTGTPNNSLIDPQQAGPALQQAQGQMSQAQGQLGQGQIQTAQASMQQASQSLQQASSSSSQSGQQKQPSGQPAPHSHSGFFGAGAQGESEKRHLAKDNKKYAGKAWGDLPGELRTKIIQDARAKYGDDYAKIIQMYFQQIADKK